MEYIRKCWRFIKNGIDGATLRNWVLSAAAFFLAPAMALAIELPDEKLWVQLVAEADGWCLETKNGKDGSEVFRRPCDTSNQKQHWNILKKDGDFVMLRGRAFSTKQSERKCITIEGAHVSQKSAKAYMKNCSLNYRSQKYAILGDLSGRGPFRIQARITNMCLELQDKGTKIVQWTCNLKSTNQLYHWRYVLAQVPVNKKVKIISEDKCLKSPYRKGQNYSLTSGAHELVGRAPCDNIKLEQRWKLERVRNRDSYYVHAVLEYDGVDYKTDEIIRVTNESFYCMTWGNKVFPESSMGGGSRIAL